MYNLSDKLDFFSYLPCSNAGEAMGDSSMLKNMMPSFGLLSLGATSSHDTWAMTLQSAAHSIITKTQLHVYNQYNMDGANLDSEHISALFESFPPFAVTVQKMLLTSKLNLWGKFLTWFSQDLQNSIHSQSQMWSLCFCSRRSVVHPGAAGRGQERSNLCSHTENYLSIKITPFIY